MPNPNPLVAEISDKNGQVYDVAAKRFSGNRTVELTGDVTGTESGWNGSGQLTVATSIGSKKVKTSMIDDNAVGTGQIDDGAVGLTQIDSTAMNGTVQDNDSKLATHAAVKTYVDAQISGQGTYLGKHTVAEINAFVTDNLHNGDRVMVSDSGTINLGPGGQGFDVVAGEDLILYKQGSTVQWDSMDGNFKTKQTAVSKSGTALKTVTAITQNANGEVDATFTDIQSASTSQAGVVQLNDATNSTSTTQAATANAVKKAYDHVGTSIAALDAEKTSTDGTNVQVKVTEVDGKVTAVNITTDNTENKNNKVSSWSSTTTDTHYPSEKLVKDSLDGKADKVGSATSGNFAGLDANGNLTDSGSKAADFATAAQGTAADNAVKDVTVGGTSVVNSTTKVAAIPDASTSAKGAVQLTDSHTSTSTTTAATPKNVKEAYDLADGKLSPTGDGKDVTSTVATVDNYTNPGSTATALKTLFGKIWNFIGRLRTSWQTTPDDSHFPSEKLVKDSLDLKAPLASPALTGTPTSPTAAAGTNTTQIATTAFVQSAVDAQKLFYNPGNTTYGYMKLGTVHVPSTKKGAFEIQVTACYNVGGTIAQIDATFSINAGTITTKSFAKGLLRYKLAYKANSESTADNLIYDIWLIDTTSGDSATRRASYVLLPTNIETWVNGNQSTQTIPDGLTYFTTLNDVSANGAVGSASIPTYVGSDGEIKICTDDFVHDADVAGFVTGPSSATADDIAVFDGMTGKIVKDGGKKISDLAQVNRTVAIADCRVQMNGHSGWYNVASATFALPGNNFVSSWLVSLYATNSSFSAETFIVNLSIRQNSGANPVVYAFNAECINKGSKNGFNANKFKVVVEGTSSLTIELWYSPGATTYGSMILRELNAGQHTGVFSKSAWTYHSLSNVAGQTTEPTGTVAELCDFIYAKNLQTAVTDPTASGTALSFIDSITQNANGEITPTKKSVTVDSTYSASGTNPVNGTAIAAALGTLDVSDSAVSGQFVSAVSETDGKINVSRRTLNNLDIPQGNKYAVTVANENDGTPFKIYEISGLGLTADYRAASAELRVYLRSTNSYRNTSYNVTVHWTRTGADVTVTGSVIKGTWTAVVVNSSTPASTDVTTLKLYYKSEYYTTTAINLESCGMRGNATFSNGTIIRGGSRESIPTASDLVIIGTTRKEQLAKIVDASEGIGSASIPVYVDGNGEVTACTNDFVHDAEISKMVSVSTAGTAVGSSSEPVYINDSGVATKCNGTVDWSKKWNGYKEVAFATETLETFKSAASVTGSFVNKLFGTTFDSTSITVDAVGRVDFGTSGLQASIGSLSRFATFHFVANRQLGYVDFVTLDSGASPQQTKTIRFEVNQYGALSRQVFLVTDKDTASTTAAGIVQFMTSAETTSMIAAAKAAAS